MLDLPFAASCENNKDPILSVLRRHISASDTRSGSEPRTALEIAGGTGQHAVYFAQHFPHLRWQSTDLSSNVDTLNLRITAAALQNLPAAFALDVTQQSWQIDAVDFIFTANSLHIMPFSAVIEFFRQAGPVLKSNGRLCVYGPFKYQGEFPSPSNAEFDLWLKERHSLSGVRDFEALNELAEAAGLSFLEDNAMPANNQLLVWKKQ
jgi:cyclopropane fatty-acyl-phospholipid synthase-like methyltransferase